MKSLKWKTAISTGLIGLALGGAVLASSDNNEADLQKFVTDHPEMQAVIDQLQTQTGGQVIEAEMGDEAKDQNLVDFEVKLADGSIEDWIYNLTDQTLQAEVDDEQADDDGGEENEASETGEAGEASEAGEAAQTTN